MQKVKYLITVILFAVLAITNVYAQDSFNLNEDFSASNTKYEKIGRGEARIAK